LHQKFIDLELVVIDLLIKSFSYHHSNNNYPQFIHLFPTAKKHLIYTILCKKMKLSQYIVFFYLILYPQ